MERSDNGSIYWLKSCLQPFVTHPQAIWSDLAWLRRLVEKRFRNPLELESSDRRNDLGQRLDLVWIL